MTIDYEHADDHLQAAAQRVANVYARIVNRRLGCTIPVPVPLNFNLELESMEMAKAAGRASPPSLGGLCEAPLCRSRAGAALSGTLHPSGGHQSGTPPRPGS